MLAQERLPIREHIDRRLLKRMRLFCIICLVMIGVIIIDVLRNIIGIQLAVEGIIIGIVIGIVVSRMYHLSWDEQNTKVVAQIDWVGGFILALYIIFMICRDWFFEHWIQAATMAAFGLSISAGSMIGRVISTRRSILKTLRALGISKGNVDK